MDDLEIQLRMEFYTWVDNETPHSNHVLNALVTSARIMRDEYVNLRLAEVTKNPDIGAESFVPNA